MDAQLKALKEALSQANFEKEKYRKEAEKAVSQANLEKEKEMDSLNLGKFFSPWSSVWEVDTVQKDKCNGAFKAVCRTKEFADGVPHYKAILQSHPEKRNASNEATVDSHGLSQRATKNDKKKKDKVARVASSASSKSSRSSNVARKSSGNLIDGSVTSSQSNQNSGNASLAGTSNASMRSQSMEYPAFGGSTPSSRAHMIPDPETTECYKYYTAICQAVLGFYPVHGNVNLLEKLAKRLAESNYNFLRAPTNHGNYFDNNPCWILVPACPLEKILGWNPGMVYPVLAVACGCVKTTVEEAYKTMCSSAYNDKIFEDDYGTGVNIGYLKRSKCKGKEFEEATKNLRKMTLAMAETLVGSGSIVKPDQILFDTLKEIDGNTRNFIIQHLKSKTADEEKGDEQSEENSDYYKLNRNPPAPKYYNAIQFEETRNSLMKGIKLPKAIEKLDLDRCELLQFDVDPNRGLDLYPDPMLLLIKAAVNWSWWCDQKLLPACGCANEEKEEEWATPSTPVPATIEFKSAPVTPDDDDDVSV